MALSPTGSGILDHHVLMALHQGWKILAADSSKFTVLFPGDLAAVAQQWWTSLNSSDQEKQLQIRLHGTRGVPSALSIIVKLENETVINSPLGEVTHFKEHRPIHQMIMAQSVLVEVAGPTPELARALSIGVRAVLQCAKFSFLKAGYLDFTLVSTEGLSPEEMLIAEQVGLAGLCIRRMHYSAQAHVDIPDIAATAQDIDWFALRNDLKTVDGLAGGVIPYGG